MNAAIDAQVLAQHGAVAMYANDGGDEVTVPVRSQMTVNARWQFVLVYTEPRAGEGRSRSRTSNAAVLDGAIRVGEDAGLPLHVFPLARDRRRPPRGAGRRRRQGADRRHRLTGTSSTARVPPRGLSASQACPPCNRACWATSASPRPDPGEVVSPRANRPKSRS